ncbi:MAG: iron ABC transporter permease [Rhodobacteraceae bacterium]|nr:iron ABC transporter permease [Paracoccaceae bacterium]
MIARCLILLASLSASAVGAQGFAGLGTTTQGFAMPDAQKALTFPRDHLSHDAFRIEWWYLTATLDGADGRDYGLQWTLFRTAMEPGEDVGWSSPHVWLGHAAVTTPDRHFAAEKFARGGIGQAGVSGDPFDAWIDDWQLVSDDAEFEVMRARAGASTWGYEVSLTANGPLVAHGEGGYSVKSPSGQASHYYSQPFFAVSGVLTLPDGPVAVTGKGWLDREWSSQPLAEDQSGWDWFSLSFDSGDKLMAFRLRDGGAGFRSGTWISADGQVQRLGDDQIVATPLDLVAVAGRDIPVRWRLQVPLYGVDVEVSALNPNSWMDLSIAYWEGPLTVSGSHQGRGYLEMTGYE